MHRLESVKNYVLTPLFTADRRMSLELLQIYNQQSPGHEDALLGDWALLRLAILDVGKKSGLVNEPGRVICSVERGHLLIEIVYREDCRSARRDVHYQPAN
jgi:hypothetical protein